MGIAVLGPLQVDGQANGLSPRDRVVLSALVVRAGESISTEALADALWGETLPASWAKVLQGCVVRLRKRLGGAAIQSAANGYRLALSEDELDHKIFERLLEGAREALAAGDSARSSYLAREALQLWRGPVLPDLEEWEPGRVETSRLEGLRMDAEEVLVEAEINAGRAREVLERGRALAAQAPFRERRWALLARALHQTGRQPEALGAIKRARAMLVEEFGLDPGRELTELEAMLLRQDPSLSPVTSREVSATCPYRGLLPYDAADADTFFGREDDIAACLRRLRDTGVLAVIGPSGVGKSSLVRAGVVASLSRSGTPVLVTTPGVLPMDSIVGLKPRGRQTLVVDQTEEAVTVCTDPAERSRYFAALALHVGAGGALVLALRADHLGDLAPYPEIARVLEDGMYLLGPMSEPGLRSAIEGPARRAGLRLEPGLVDLLVREVEGEPAALPLLSHVLRETWERREGPTLTVAGYRATGGIRQAVSRSAESLYDAMDATQRSQLRSLLLRLVMPTEDGDPVRARVPRSKVAVDAGHSRLVEQLVAARLVSIDGETLQIAHEALVRVWPRLRGWLDDDVDGQRLFRHLAGAADAWESMSRPDSELYRGTRLSRTLEWRDSATPDLDDTENAFLDASIALSEAEKRAAETRIARERTVNRRLRGALAGVGVLLVLTLVAGVLAVRSADQARRNLDQSEAAARLAEARGAGAQALNQDIAAVSLLLGLAALQVDDSPQEWENLATTLTRLGSLQRIQETVGASVSLAVSGDGALVAVGNPEAGLQLFDATTLAPIEFDDDTPTSAITFSPDGKLMAAAVNQWTGGPTPRIVAQPVHLYDVPSGELSARQPGGWPSGANVEYSLAFSHDGDRLVAGVNRYLGPGGPLLAAVLVWEVADPSKPVFKVNMPDLPQAALSPDGRLVYTATIGPRSVRVFDVDSGRLLQWTGSGLIKQPLKGAVDVSPDGSSLAVATGNRILRFDTKTLETQGKALRGHTAEVTDIEYSHDGSMLLSTSVDRTTIVWDADSGVQLGRFAAHRDQIWGAGFSRDDRTVFTSSGPDSNSGPAVATSEPSDSELMAWDVTGHGDFLSVGEAGSTGEGKIGVSLAGPDGQSVARIWDDRVWFVDYRTGQETRPVSMRKQLSGHVWSPDSRWLLTIGPGVLSLRDAETGRLVGQRSYRPGVRVLAAFGADGNTIYVDDRAGHLESLDPATLAPVREPVAFVRDAVSLLPDPRGETLLVLKEFGSIAWVDPANGTILQSTRELLTTEDRLAAVSPNGSVLAAVNSAGSVRLIDAHTLEWASMAAGFDVVYAPDGSQFASVQPDRIKLWDGRTGAYQASIPLPNLPAAGLWSTGSGGPGMTIAYLPDSKGLLVASADGRIFTVDTRTDMWLERACRIAGRNLTQAEWKQFLPSRPYQVTCPQWPSAG
jgi:DNA-binding SARP family transcriptional activator/WD40 repeat protein